jgi:hypothetical protein
MKIQLVSAIGCLLVIGGLPVSTPAQTREEFEPPTFTKESDAVVKLDSLVGGAEIWARDAAAVETAFKNKGLAWLNKETKDRAVIRPAEALLKTETGGRSEIKFIRQQLEVFGRPVHEATLEFAAGKLSNVTLSIWNKGDAEQGITEARFNELSTQSIQSADAALKVRGRDMGRDTTTGARTARYRWETPDTLAQLEFSSSRGEDRSFQAEFVRLRLMPRPKSLIGGNAALVNAGRVNVADLPKNLKRNEEGDVFIGSLPMVDQGEKGYCAVASAERVLRYFGLQIDQHEIANAAATTATRGTRPDEFEDAIHAIQNKLKLKGRDLITFDERDYEKLVQNYNREAKKLGGRSWDPYNYFFEANPDILREAKCRNGAYEKFRGFVVAATDRGLPLLWALHLGQYPETGRDNPQGGGGHMRTIIGYNAKSDEVIFTDSWGAGHEFKKMKGRDACAATLGLYLMEPNR